MELSEAIEAIKGLEAENKEEIIKALNLAIEARDGEIAKVKEEIAQYIAKNKEFEDTIANNLKTAEVEITSHKNQIQELAEQLSTSKETISSLERTNQLAQIAATQQANHKVLSLLVKDEDQINPDLGKINGKDLREWATENHGDFVKSLFPDSNKQLGDASPHGEQTGSPSDSFFRKTVKPPSFLVKK